MAGGTWRDVRELVGYVTAFEHIVAPIVRRVGLPRYLDDSLCEACTGLCILLAAYATTAGVRFRADLAVLGGAIARVYDDLVDLPGTEDADERVAALFDDREAEPRTVRERLLYELYRELELRLGRERTDPVYSALRSLHHHQVRSRTQRDPAIEPHELADITRAKGGHAMVVFAGLMHPRMNQKQVNAVWRLGGALQLLDDYVDRAADRRAGITTVATRDQVSPADIRRGLRAVRPALVSCFGRDQPLSAVLQLHLWSSLVCVAVPGWPVRWRPLRVAVRVIRRRVSTAGHG